MTDIVREPWTYEVDGQTHKAWKVWHVPPPGPIGSGIRYREDVVEDVLGGDGRWERHVLKITVCDAPEQETHR